MRLVPIKKSVLLMFVLLLIMTLLPIGLFTLKDASKTVERDIYHFARGSYDILLRPPSSRTEIEKQIGVVEENYLGVGDGGITLEQWEKVLNNEEVAIAAPVSAIGLFTAPQVSYSLPARDTPLHYTLTYTTTDGVNVYPLGEPIHAFTIPDERSDSGLTEILSDIELLNVFWADAPSFLVPPSYHQVVAIDPEQEEMMTGSNFKALENSGPSAIGGGEFTQIPVLSLQGATTPKKAELIIEELNITLEQIENLREKYGLKESRRPFPYLLFEKPDLNEQLISDLANLNTMDLEKYGLDFSNKIAPFYDNYIYLNDQYQLVTQEERPMEEIGGVIDSRSQETFYQVQPIDYILQEDGNIRIAQTGYFKDSAIPIHRDIEELSTYTYDLESLTVIEGDPIHFSHVGYFHVIDDNTPLAASPMGIYGLQETYPADNPEQIIKPTAVPGSFIVTPAHGLLSIEWAEQIKGPAPIDAIRVKVAGIEGYDVAAANKIKALAKAFDADGFTVDIVAGASHQSLTLDVEGIGEVIQPWTSLGAADTILQSWNMIGIIVVIILFVVSSIYILFSFRNLVKERERDENVLRELGWDESNIKRLRRKEFTILAGFPLFIGLAFLLFITFYLEWDGLIMYGIGAWAVFISFMLLGAWSANKKEKINQRRLRGPLSLQNVWYYRHYVLIAIIQVMLMTIVSVFLTSMFMHEKEKTTITTLGIYVHGEVGWYTIALLAIIYLLTFITVIESLSMLWKQRKHEFLLLTEIGWSTRKMYSHFLRENMIWLGISIIIGTVASVASYHWIVQSVHEQWLAILLSFIAIVIAMIGLSIFILASFMRKAKST